MPPLLRGQSLLLAASLVANLLLLEAPAPASGSQAERRWNCWFTSEASVQAAASSAGACRLDLRGDAGRFADGGATSGAGSLLAEGSDTVKRLTWRGPFEPDALHANGSLLERLPIRCNESLSPFEVNRPASAFDLRRSCTGDFAEQAPGGSAERPPPGTLCASPCLWEPGRWGESFCWTDPDASLGLERQWGAPCVPCAAEEAFAPTMPEVLVIGQRTFATMPALLPSASRQGGVSVAACYCSGSTCGGYEDFTVQLGLVLFWTSHLCHPLTCAADLAAAAAAGAASGVSVAAAAAAAALRRAARAAPQQRVGLAVLCPPGGCAGSADAPAPGRVKLVLPGPNNDLPSWHPQQGCRGALSAEEFVEWQPAEAADLAAEEESAGARADFRVWDAQRGAAKLFMRFGRRLDVCFSLDDTGDEWFKVGVLSAARGLALGLPNGTSAETAAVAGRSFDVELLGGLAAGAAHGPEAIAAIHLGPYEASAFVDDGLVRLLFYDRIPEGSETNVSREERLAFDREAEPEGFDQALHTECQEANLSSPGSIEVAASPEASNLVAQAPSHPAGLVVVCYCGMLDGDGACADDSSWLFVGLLTVRGPRGGQVFRLHTFVASPLTIHGWALDALDRLRIVAPDANCDESPPAEEGVMGFCVNGTNSSDDPLVRGAHFCQVEAQSELELAPLTAQSVGIGVRGVRLGRSSTVLEFSGRIRDFLNDGDMITLSLGSILANGRRVSNRDTALPPEWHDIYRLSGEYEYQDALLSSGASPRVLGHRVSAVLFEDGTPHPSKLSIPIGWREDAPEFAFVNGLGLWTRRSEAQMVETIKATTAQEGLQVCWGVQPADGSMVDMHYKVGEITFVDPPPFHRATAAFATLQAGAITPLIIAFQTAPQHPAYRSGSPSSAGRMRLLLQLSLDQVQPYFADDAPPSCYAFGEGCPEAMPVEAPTGVDAVASQAACGRLFSELWSDDEEGFPVLAGCRLNGIVKDEAQSLARHLDIELDFSAKLGMRANTKYMLVMNSRANAAMEEPLLSISAACVPGDVSCDSAAPVFERSQVINSNALVPEPSPDEARLVEDGLQLVPSTESDGWLMHLHAEANESLTVQFSLRPDSPTIQEGAVLRLLFWPLALWRLDDVEACEVEADCELEYSENCTPLDCFTEALLPPEPAALDALGGGIGRSVLRIELAEWMNVSGDDEPVNLTIPASALALPAAGFFPARIGTELSQASGSAWYTTSPWAWSKYPDDGETSVSFLVTERTGHGPRPFIGEENELVLRVRLGSALGGGYYNAAAAAAAVASGGFIEPPPPPVPPSLANIHPPDGFLCLGAQGAETPRGGHISLPPFALNISINQTTNATVCTLGFNSPIRFHYGQVLYVKLFVKNPEEPMHPSSPESLWQLSLLGQNKLQPPPSEASPNDTEVEMPRVAFEEAFPDPPPDGELAFPHHGLGRGFAERPATRAGAAVVRPLMGALIQPTNFARSCCGPLSFSQRRVVQWLRIFFRPSVPVGRMGELIVDAPYGFDFGDTCSARDLTDEYYASAGEGLVRLRRLGKKVCVGDMFPSESSTFNRARITVVAARDASRTSGGGQYGEVGPHYGLQLQVAHPSGFSPQELRGWLIWSTDEAGYPLESSFGSVGLFDPSIGSSSNGSDSTEEGSLSWGSYTEALAETKVQLISVLPYDLVHADTEAIIYPIEFPQRTVAPVRITAPEGFEWTLSAGAASFKPATHGAVERMDEPSEVLGNILLWSRATFKAGEPYGFRHTIRVPNLNPRTSSNAFFIEVGFEDEETGFGRVAAAVVDCPMVASLINVGVGCHTMQVGLENRIEFELQTITPIPKGGGFIITSDDYRGFEVLPSIRMLPGSDPLPPGVELSLERSIVLPGQHRIELASQERSIEPGYYKFELQALNPIDEMEPGRWRFGTFHDVTLHPGAAPLDMEAEASGFPIQKRMLRAELLQDRHPNVTLQDPELRDDRPGQRSRIVLTFTCERRPGLEDMVIRAPAGFEFEEACLESLDVDLHRLVEGWPNVPEAQGGSGVRLAEWPDELAPTGCLGRGPTARVSIPLGLRDEESYAIAVTLQNAMEIPTPNHWSVSYCSEASNPFEGFPLWSFTGTRLDFSSYGRGGRSASVSFTFRPVQPVPPAGESGVPGLFRAEAPSGFRFLAKPSSLERSCLEVQVYSPSMVLPWSAGSYRCTVGPDARTLDILMTGHIGMQAIGQEYVVMAVVDFPFSPGYSGDWRIQSFLGPSASTLEALDLTIFHGFELHDDVARFVVVNPIPEIYADLRPGRWVDGITVEVQFNDDIENGDGITLRAPQGYQLLQEGGLPNECAGFGPFLDSGALPFEGTGAPQCFCEGALSALRCHLEWAHLSETASPVLPRGKRLRFRLDAKNPVLTPRLTTDYWRIEHHHAVELREELIVGSRAEFVSGANGTLVTRFFGTFVPERHAKASSQARSWPISSCFGAVPTVRANDGGAASVSREFTLDLLNVCGGLSSDDRLLILGSEGECGADRWIAMRLGFDGPSVPGSTNSTWTSLEWPGLVLERGDDYKVCWCSGNESGADALASGGAASGGLCTRPEDFVEFVGVVQVRGPRGFLTEYLNPSAGQLFTLVVAGIGLGEFDRVRILGNGAQCNSPGAEVSSNMVLGPASCTGSFAEAPSRAGNGRFRPPAGTPCAEYCAYQAGRWGDSWCWTEPEDTPDRQWGAPCMPCQNTSDELDLPGVPWLHGSRRWSGLNLLEQGPYSVCWCPGSPTGCTSGAHFDIEVAVMDAWGPQAADHHCEMDRPCTLTVRGVAPQNDGSTVEIRVDGPGGCASPAPSEPLPVPGLLSPWVLENASAVAYSRLRFTPLKTLGGGCSLRVSDIVFYSGGSAIDLSGASSSFVGGGGGTPTEFAVDDNSSTQFTDPSCVGLLVELPDPVKVDAIGFVTADGDEESRLGDPYAFVVEVEDQGMWTMLVRTSSFATPVQRQVPTAAVPFTSGVAEYRVGVPSGAAIGTYRICWSMREEGPFIVDGGTVTLLGLRGIQDQWCFAGAACKLGPISGSGLSAQDKVLAVQDFGG